MPTFHLHPGNRKPLLKDQMQPAKERALPIKATRTHVTTAPSAGSAHDDASVYFIGTATMIIEWHGFRILTDPNFIHQGDHVHLGPGVNATRETNPAVDLHNLPPVDLVLLSHYHEDHFDKLVESSLNRRFPIISTEHAKTCLEASVDSDGNSFSNVTSLAFWENSFIITDPHSAADGKAARRRAVRITALPGSHVPPGPLALINSMLQAIPPTNGWFLEFGYSESDTSAAGFECQYTIYISGDTLFVDELQQIPQRLGRKVDLMLVHLGGTTVPSPAAPVAMVTMDAEQGVKLMDLIKPFLTIPIHYDDYSVFASPLSDFQDLVKEGKKENSVVYLDRGDEFTFSVGRVVEAL